jgi:putative ABC transport system permease protein
MIIVESVSSGWGEIRANMLRSALSVSAVAFGSAAMLFTFAQVHSFRVELSRTMDLAGHGRFEISANGSHHSKGLSKGLTWADAQAVRKALPEIPVVFATRESSVDFQVGKFKSRVNAVGVSTQWALRDWDYALRGRFFNSKDEELAARVCVVPVPGGWIEKPFWAGLRRPGKYELFVGHNDLLGRSVAVKDHLFTVVGTLRLPPGDRDKTLGWRDPRTLYVPITTAQKVLGSRRGGNPDRVDKIVADAGSAEAVPRAKRLVETLLLSRHRGEGDFEMQDWRERMEGTLRAMREQALNVLSVGAVAILAGGIGIMNVTLAIVFFRTREIGIRRAVGASRRDILSQFVIEAMLLGFVGGVAGVPLGLAGIVYLASNGREQLENLQAWHLLASLAISAGAGFLFSLYPAWKASRMDPVQALRYE